MRQALSVIKIKLFSLYNWFLSMAKSRTYWESY